VRYGRAQLARCDSRALVRFGEIGRACSRVERTFAGLVGGVPGVALAPTFRQPAQVPDLEVGCVDLGRGVLSFGELVGDGGQEIGALGQAAVGEVRPQPGAGDWP
jgi:hypothetical protein